MFSAMTSFADGLIIENATIDAGETGQLNVMLVVNNPETNYIACQFDVTLPAGLDVQRTAAGKVSKAKTCELTGLSSNEEEEFEFNFTIAEVGTNHYRFTMYNDANAPFMGTAGGVILRLNVTASDSFAGGEGKIHAITMTNGARQGYSPEDATFTVSSTTGINDLKVDGSDSVYFNLAGQRVENTTKGLYIQNGKKLILK